MAAVGELVRSTTGAWMVRPPQHCPRGHPLRPGRVLVGSIACPCGRHLTWRCECGAVTYAPPLGVGCTLLHGPARVPVRNDLRRNLIRFAPINLAAMANCARHASIARERPTIEPRNCHRLLAVLRRHFSRDRERQAPQRRGRLPVGCAAGVVGVIIVLCLPPKSKTPPGAQPAPPAGAAKRGWYPDPAGTGLKRYWNDKEWSDLPPRDVSA
jgi:hypothetical protein